jgi:putative ABC transport system permease protein
MRRIEILTQAFRNLRANLLRASLTLMIIALGIMALVGILTALDGIIFSLTSNFSGLGADSFTIVRNDQGRHEGPFHRVVAEDPINYRQALQFKSNMAASAPTSVSLMCSQSETISYGDKKTNPNVVLMGVDEHHFNMGNFTFEAGRDFTMLEVENGSSYVVLGRDLVKLLFNDKPEWAIGRDVTIGSNRYSVIGVLASKGSTMSENTDKIAFIPLARANNQFDNTRSDYDIRVSVGDITRMADMQMQASVLMRGARRLRVEDDDDFHIQSSEGLLNIIKENTVMIRSATIAIGLITLLGAAIGLMNIMLVSVTERTREIGISKSLGATKSNIRQMFLTEAILICLVGGLLGVVLGVFVGNLVSMILGSDFLMPWNWIVLGLVFSVLVGVLAGFYPANRAAGLDPIEALRYE